MKNITLAALLLGIVNAPVAFATTVYVGATSNGKACSVSVETIGEDQLRVTIVDYSPNEKVAAQSFSSEVSKDSTEANFSVQQKNENGGPISIQVDHEFSLKLSNGVPLSYAVDSKVVEKRYLWMLQQQQAGHASWLKSAAHEVSDSYRVAKARLGLADKVTRTRTNDFCVLTAVAN